jgi:hypothetical protein
MQRKKIYLISILEDVCQGILETKDPQRHCLAYCREFQNTREHLTSPGLNKFFEGKQNENRFELDEESY